MTGLLLDTAGWAGAFALLTAYALVSTGRVTGSALMFQLLNLGGAGGLAANGIYHGAWPSAALNAVWLLIGLTALARLTRRGPHTDRTAAGQHTRRTSTSAGTAPTQPPVHSTQPLVHIDPQEKA